MAQNTNRENTNNGNGKSIRRVETLGAYGKPSDVTGMGRPFVLMSKTDGEINVILSGAEGVAALLPVFAGKDHHYDVDEIVAGGDVPLSDIIFCW